MNKYQMTVFTLSLFFVNHVIAAITEKPAMSVSSDRKMHDDSCGYAENSCANDEDCCGGCSCSSSGVCGGANCPGP